MSIFEALNSINVNDKTEKKNGLTYLSWAWAWGEVKKLYPDANFTIYERPTEYGPVNYFTDGKTCWVKTGLTINGLEHIEELPVMNYANRSIPLDAVTSTDVNKAIQRSLTKAAARHGLGLYIYAGEDLPECESGKKDSEPDTKQEPKAESKRQKGTAEVTVADTLPQIDVNSYMRQEITKIQKFLELDSYDDAKGIFTGWVNALGGSGELGKVDLRRLDMATAQKVIKAVHANFMGEEE